MIERKRLEEVGHIITGTTPATSQLSTDECDGIPFLTPADIQHRSPNPVTERYLSKDDIAKYKGRMIPPGATAVTCIGSIGKTTFTASTSLTNQQINSIVPFSNYDRRFVYYSALTVVDSLLEIAGGSATPILNKTAFSGVRIPVFPLERQQHIAAVLGSLDDKIAANSCAIEKALLLQVAVWEDGIKGVGSVPLVSVSEPILGGTPPRKDESNWGDGYNWASVADMTASPRSHLLRTAETITGLAAKRKRYAPLPAGSVLLSARGTVGRVVSLVEPSAFNQSAYGFKIPTGLQTAFRMAVISVVDELRAKSYGSVFSTITKAQINEAFIPAVFETADHPLHRQLNSLESLVIALEKENLALANTRDELLPLLMSGKISVREANQDATAAGVDIPDEEVEAESHAV